MGTLTKVVLDQIDRASTVEFGYLVTQDSRENTALPESLQGNMSGHLIRWDPIWEWVDYGTWMMSSPVTTVTSDYTAAKIPDTGDKEGFMCWKTGITILEAIALGTHRLRNSVYEARMRVYQDAMQAECVSTWTDIRDTASAHVTTLKEFLLVDGICVLTIEWSLGPVAGRAFRSKTPTD